MSFRIGNTALREVKVFEPHIEARSTGAFFRSFDPDWFNENVSRGYLFTHDEQAVCPHNALVGLTYQVQSPRGIVLRALSGEIYAVALDLRRMSITFGRWAGVPLSASSCRQLWIPPGFAHGFIVRSDVAEVLSKASSPRMVDSERTICWDDADLNIDWGTTLPITERRQRGCVDFNGAEYF
ncbi:dTDP-4-dehydrorhamnose 3,5-epimerase family protein [Paraburkholderia sp. JHI869]|uniref:dTDP-4-dehydrorhamnose 3,5-epimerase family protein n=1 Tax=Paraburkholderia sp. JHI869 TaxID=3112959 RepID=UPI00317EE658